MIINRIHDKFDNTMDWKCVLPTINQQLKLIDRFIFIAELSEDVCLVYNESIGNRIVKRHFGKSKEWFKYIESWSFIIMANNILIPRIYEVFYFNIIEDVCYALWEFIPSDPPPSIDVYTLLDIGNLIFQFHRFNIDAKIPSNDFERLWNISCINYHGAKDVDDSIDVFMKTRIQDIMNGFDGKLFPLHNDISIKNIIWKNNHAVGFYDLDDSFSGPLEWEILVAATNLYLSSDNLLSIETIIEQITKCFGAQVNYSTLKLLQPIVLAHRKLLKLNRIN